MLSDLRPRSDKAHLATNHINQLWQFIQLQAAQQSSHLCHTRVTMPRNGWSRIEELTTVLHGSELQNDKRLLQ